MDPPAEEPSLIGRIDSRAWVWGEGLSPSLSFFGLPNPDGAAPWIACDFVDDAGVDWSIHRALPVVNVGLDGDTVTTPVRRRMDRLGCTPGTKASHAGRWLRSVLRLRHRPASGSAKTTPRQARDGMGMGMHTG
jgi:hypothetical protein